MKSAAWMVVMVAACAPGLPATDPNLGFLRVGVDPHVEARALSESLVRAGWTIDARLEGHTFAALAAAHPERRDTLVRIVTRRGIALAMDVPGDEGAQPLGLLVPPGDDHDRDGDGFEEVIVVQRDPERERRCLALVRIREEGYVMPVPAELAPFGPDACIEGLGDVTGDGRPEVLVPFRLEALSHGSVPTVDMPLLSMEGRYRFRPQRLRGWWRDEGERRRRALQQARAERDVGRAYTLAVELAVLAEAQGGSPRQRVLAFDEALRGLVLTEPLALAVAAARDRIARGAIASGQ